MKPFCTAVLCAVALAGCGPFGDQRWEGPADRCTGGMDDFRVLLLLDGPVVTPRVSGMVGELFSADDAVVADFDDAEWTPNSLKVEARFRNGSSSVTWEMDLTAKPGGGYEGDLDISTSTGTVKCDVELKRE